MNGWSYHSREYALNTLPGWRLLTQILIQRDYLNPAPCDTTVYWFSLPAKMKPPNNRKTLSNAFLFFNGLGINSCCSINLNKNYLRVEVLCKYWFSILNFTPIVTGGPFHAPTQQDHLCLCFHIFLTGQIIWNAITQTPESLLQGKHQTAQNAQWTAS